MTIRCIAITLLQTDVPAAENPRVSLDDFALAGEAEVPTGHWRLCSCAAHQCVSRGGPWQSSF